MPNHVTNQITFGSDAASLAAFQHMLHELRAEDQPLGSVDFNKLIPMPPELKIECGSRTDAGLKLYREFVAESSAVSLSTLHAPEAVRAAQVTAHLEKWDAKEKADPALWELGKSAFQNIQKYGAPTWYEWSIQRWGTKWNPINEDLARRAKEMNSFFDYVPGSTTEAYQRAVDRAAEMAEFQKQRVDPIHHEKIDRLLDAYARRLAENIDQSNSISARVPSILISGGGNFPVRKKEKQNRAADANMEEWRQIQGLDLYRRDLPPVPARVQRKLPVHPLETGEKVRSLLYRPHAECGRSSPIPHCPDHAGQQ